MDLEDDTHMENNTVKVQEIVNVPVMLHDDMLDAIAKRLAERVEAMDLEQMIDDRIEYFMSHSFDINDYSRDIDLYDVKRNLVDEVIETIKDRLS
jgi:predicted transcriptional regulator